MNPEQAQLEAAIAALESQRATLGDAVVEMVTAPLRARLAALQRPAGLKHRLVTVLFADVVGSTAMANAMEAEDTLGLLSAALRRMAALIEAHQGRVLRFTGDGVKAAFGMDETREDDAERAVRAGLAILAAGREQTEAAARLHGITDFAVRVGVHSGDVALGEGVEDDNTAMGAAVNIAARMEQHAPPGGLRISHDTWSQVRGLFELEAQPPLLVKGIEAPMQTYLVRAALERGAASVERGLQGLATPMVGRDAELQRLLQTIERARESRQLQALTLIGDAGLGKSRLLREAMAALQDCRLLTLRSQPDSQLRPWGLLRSLLALQCGVADTDSADVAKRKVVDGLSPWFAEHGGRGERQAQLIGQLSGLDFADGPTVKGLDPRSLRDQALMALRAYLQALAAQGSSLPVLIVEDLHWADDSSLDLLQHLLAHAAELPLALVMTARPPLLVRRPDWVEPDAADAADGPVALMTLSPLPADQGNELLQALLQRLGEVPPRLSELIVGCAEGNPYYMEELVRRLLDDGVIDAAGPQWTVRLHRLDTLRLPTTLVGLLQARLDALPAGERQAARQASVIGHVFWDDALQALDAQAPQALPALQRAAFVKDHETSDFEGTTERQFDHHLLHQVTYDTLLKAERKLGHGAAARWLQARTQGRGAEFLAMTGAHAERAGEMALAIDCFQQAGKEAELRFSNAAAVLFTRRALALVGEAEPLRRFDLLNRLEKIADTTGDRSGQDALIAEMDLLLVQHPDGQRRASLLLGQALLASRRNDNVESERLSRQTFDMADGSGAANEAAMALANLAWLCIERSDYSGARKHIEIALPYAGKVQDERLRSETEAQVLTVAAMISTETGQLGDARNSLLAVLSRGEVIASPRVQLGALDNLALIASYLGRWDETAAWAEQARVLALSIEAPASLAWSQQWLARAAEALGDLASAQRWYGQSLVINRALANRLEEATTLRFLGSLHLRQGDAQAASPCCARALALHQALAAPLEGCAVMATAALCEIRLGQREGALPNLNESLALLNSELADCPPAETIPVRWTCHQVLQPLGDGRAMPMLEQLHADVQATAAERTDAADRDRLIQAIADFRDIVAAYGRRGAAP
jgi:class 3 adenylate cyclase